MDPLGRRLYYSPSREKSERDIGKESSEALISDDPCGTIVTDFRFGYLGSTDALRIEEASRVNLSDTLAGAE